MIGILTTIKERIIQFADYKGLVKENFYKEIGVASSNFKGKNKESEIRANVLTKILTIYPELNPAWLLTGEGEMIRSSRSNVTPLVTFDDPSELELIKKIDSTEFRILDEEHFMVVTPLINQYAYAGFVSGYADPEYIEELPKHFIITKELKLGSYISLEIRGDSMDNGRKGCYSSGDVVTAKKLLHRYWTSALHLHRYNRFIIVSDDGIVVKEIKQHKVDEGIILLSSLNEDKKTYPDYEVNLSEVKDLYYIVANTERTA